MPRTLPSAADLLGDVSSEKELQIERDHIKRQNLIAIAHILLPAALYAAAGGHPGMKAAVLRAWPYIKSL